MTTFTDSTMPPVVAVIAAVAISLMGATALGASPDEVVEERTEAVAAVLAEPDSSERTQRLAETIDESLDFEFLAALALGEHWEERSEEEREEFLGLLRQLLLHNYEDRLGGRELDEDYTIDYEDAQVRRDRAFVPAQIHHDEREEPVVYRLYRDGEQGEWTIYDLIVDDMSLEETYREGYVPIIEEHGWGELIDRMERRLEKLEGQTRETAGE